MPKGLRHRSRRRHRSGAYARYAAGATEAIRRNMAAGRWRAAAATRRSKARRAARNVVIEFESYDAARAYYFSQEYQAAKAEREGAAQMEIVLVEGV